MAGKSICAPEGGTLPVGDAIGNLLQWNGAAWIPVMAPTGDGQIAFWDVATQLWTLNAAPGAAGDTLVWNGTTWVPTATPGGLLPLAKYPGDLLVGAPAADGTWADGSAPNLFQTQAVWCVDPVGGDDANNGLTAITALKSVDNLNLRLWTPTCVLQQNTTIHILSSLPAGQVLRLPRLAAGFTGTVIGTTTVLYSGTITGVVNRVLGTSAPNITDATIPDFAPYLDKRIKITAGGASGRWAFIEVRLGAKQVEVSQWNIDGAENNATANTYNIEDLPILGGVYYENPDTPDGFGSWFIRDVQCYKAYSNSADIAVNFAGCKIGKNASFANFGGEGGNLLGCYVVGNFVQFSGAWLLQCCGSPVGSLIEVEDGVLSLVYDLFQEQVHAGPNSFVQFATDNSIRNAAHPDEAIQIDTGSAGQLVTGALWGANPAVLHGLHVYAGGDFTQNSGTTLSIIGSTGSVVNVGSVLVPIAQLPFEVNGARAMVQGSLSVIACQILYAGTNTENAEANGSCVAVSTATSIRRGHISYQKTNDTLGGRFVGLKDRAGANVQSGDQVALLVGGGWDGADYSGSTRFVVEVDGAVAAGSVPMAATIYTGAGAAPTLRSKWSSTGAWSVPGLSGLTAGLLHSSSAGVLSTSLGAANQVYNTNGAATDTQWSTIGGDVSGSIAAVSVDKIKGGTVPATPVIGDVGKLFYVSAAATYALAAAAGDVTGAPTAFVVAQINGATVPASPAASAVGKALEVSAANILAYVSPRQLLYACTSTSGADAANRWPVIGGSSLVAPAAAYQGAAAVMDRAGFITNIEAGFKVSALPVANATFTVQINGVDSALAVVVNATTLRNAATGSIAYAVGDKVGVKMRVDAADATGSQPYVTLAC